MCVAGMLSNQQRITDALVLFLYIYEKKMLIHCPVFQLVGWFVLIILDLISSIISRATFWAFSQKIVITYSF